jgi:hypothetical protein
MNYIKVRKMCILVLYSGQMTTTKGRPALSEERAPYEDKHDV